MRFFFLWVLMAASLLAESVAGLRWTAPPGWKNEGSRPMRAATYKVPAAPGDPDGFECVVYFFGAGQGGSVEANIQRWKDQFRDAGGKPAGARIAKRNIRGLPVTTIDTAGEYTGMGGPNATESHAAPGFRMLGAVIEGPGGNVFIKFAAPARTVDANRQRFGQLLDSFEKDTR